MQTVRLGKYQNVGDSELASMFPHPNDIDFAWDSFRSGYDVVEAALEIQHRCESVINPKPWWKTAVVSSSEFSFGYDAYRNSLISQVVSMNELYYQASVGERLRGQSLRRLRELFNVI
jgi:hypothetical protein